MTPEQRLDRLERVAKLFIVAGRRARTQSREQGERINVLIYMHMQNAAQWRAESHELDEKIGILINTQIEASEQIQRTAEQVNRTSERVTETSERVTETSEQIRGLAAGQTRAEKEMAELREAQKLTDKALRAFINSLRKGGNGNSS